MIATSPDWSHIDTVLIDMDGTLLDLGFDDRFWRERLPREVAARHRLSVDAAWARMVELFESTRGTLDWYCIDFWSRTLDVDIATLKRALRHEVAWLPRAREFLGRVRASGRRVVIVTNAHPETLAIKDSHVGLVRHVDRAISSHDLRAPKEQPDFWTSLAATEAIDSARTLFLDDSPSVLAAARDFGIRHVVGIREPVIGAPPRTLEGFTAVAGVRDLVPGVPQAPAQSAVGVGG
jgi:HAD superfamily hydrolase (TIGR01509 family)